MIILSQLWEILNLFSIFSIESFKYIILYRQSWDYEINFFFYVNSIGLECVNTAINFQIREMREL